MKILIVGSKGFIGSHCVDRFSYNHEVWECDVILEYSNPRYISIDSVDSDFLEIFNNQQFDVCINCSGAANVPFSMEKPYNDFRLNTLNVFKLLEAIRLHNPKCKFITLSSAAVYGNPKELPIATDANREPVSPYGYHKVISELICEEYSRFWDIKTCCLRIFSAYGPRLKKQLFWDMYQKFEKDEVIKLWGTGRESRDFIFIDDIIDIIELAIYNSKFNGEVINVANGKEITIREVADSFVSILNTPKKVVFNQAARKGDPINWVADISIIKSWGYEQKTTLLDGIKHYVSWIRECR